MYYQRGTVATATPWGNPTREKIRTWTAHMAPHFTGYTPVVVGRCLYDIANTRDFDIAFTGAIADFDALRDLLNLSIAVGFELDMLVDPKWINNTMTATYNNNRISIADTTFVFLDYYEEDNGLGSKIIRNYALNPKYTVVSPGLVSSTYAKITSRLKPHQEDHLRQHGCFLHKPLVSFLKGE